MTTITVNGNLFMNTQLQNYNEYSDLSNLTAELWLEREKFDEFIGIATFSNNSFSISYEVPDNNQYNNQNVKVRIKQNGRYLSYYREGEDVLSDFHRFYNIPNNPINIRLSLEDAIMSHHIPQQSLTFRLLDMDNTPIISKQVTIKILDADDNEIVDLGKHQSNNRGYIAATYRVTPATIDMLSVSNNKFEFSFEENGTVFHSVEVGFDTVDFNSEAILVNVSLPDYYAATSLSLAQLESENYFSLATTIKDYLASNEINSLYDIRRAGGLTTKSTLIAQLSDEELLEAKKVDAFAQFEIINLDAAYSAELVANGYFSLTDIAQATQEEFAQKLISPEQPGSAYNALKTHQSAQDSLSFAKNQLVGILANHTHPQYTTIKGVLAEIEDKCSCDECETATSPFAYLVDLISYVTKNVEQYDVTYQNNTIINTSNKTKVSLNSLEQKLFQPFGSLSKDCSELDTKICQYRVAIEVLNGYKDALTIATGCQESAFFAAQKKFTRDLYFAVLEQLGTSYYELRKAKNDPVFKAQLADNLGLSTIDDLFIELDSIINASDEGVLSGFLDSINRWIGLENVLNTATDAIGASPSPKIIAQRKTEYLRNKWKEQDKVSMASFIEKYGYTIDPDIITVDDFRKQNGTAFSLWQSRKEFIDNIYTSVFDNESYRHNENAFLGGAISFTGGSVSFVAGDTIKIDFIKNSNNNGNNISEFLGCIIHRVKSVQSINSKTVVFIDSTINAKFDNANSFQVYKIENTTVTHITDPSLTNPPSVEQIGNVYKYTVEDTMTINLSNNIVEVYNGITKEGELNLFMALTPGNSSTSVLYVIDNGVFNFNIVKVNNQPSFVSEVYKANEPNFGEIFNLFKDTFATPSPLRYANSTITKIWDITAINDIKTIVAAINAKTATTADLGKLQLSADAILRLDVLYSKYQLHRANGVDSYLTKEEQEELFNLLILSVKNAYADFWHTEEATVKIDNTVFWTPITAPKSVAYVERRNPIVPMVYPPYTTAADLPDAISAGATAYSLLVARRDISSITNSWAGKTLGNILNDVWGYPYNTDGAKDLIGSLKVKQDAVSNTELSNEFEYLIACLGISLPTFEIIKQYLQASVLSNTELQSLFPELAKAYIQIHKLKDYLDEEQADDFDTKYWLVKKQALIEWRASETYRKDWTDILKQSGQMPNIEPDIVFVRDVARVNSAAFDKLVDRKIQLNDKQTQYINFSNIAGFNTQLVDALAISITDFEQFETIESNGETLAPYLNRIQLDYPAYRRIVSIRELLSQPTPAILTPDEKEEVANILVNVYKLREYYPVWNREEAATNFYVNPDDFTDMNQSYAPDAVDFYTQLTAWRANWKTRQKWEKKVKARKKQLAAILPKVNQMVEEVENSLLLQYKNALVNLLGDGTKTFKEKAQQLSDSLLVDFSMTCCQHTTRLSQAITTLQQLIWTEKIGIDKKVWISDTTATCFELKKPLHFEEEWKWMGSYATWRAAMFVFMFPENLLSPSLRKWQSPAFATLINEVRNNNKLNPTDACLAAKDYNDYLMDVANLELVCSATAMTVLHHQRCTNGHAIDGSILFYGFAKSKLSGKVYYYTKDTCKGNEMDAHTYWKPLEQLGEKVVRIVGSPVYENVDTGRFIMLFCVVRDNEKAKLTCLKYNLDTQQWDNSCTDYDVEDGGSLVDIQILQRSYTKDTPKFLLMKNGIIDEYDNSAFSQINLGATKKTLSLTLHTNSISKDGKKWMYKNWAKVSSGSHRTKVTRLNAYYELDRDSSDGAEEVIIGTTNDKTIKYKLLGKNDCGFWGQLLFQSTFKSIFQANPNERAIEIKYQFGNFGILSHSIKFGRIANNTIVKEINFDNFVRSMIGTGQNLHNINLYLNRCDSVLYEDYSFEKERPLWKQQIGNTGLSNFVLILGDRKDSFSTNMKNPNIVLPTWQYNEAGLRSHTILQYSSINDIQLSSYDYGQYYSRVTELNLAKPSTTSLSDYYVINSNISYNFDYLTIIDTYNITPSLGTYFPITEEISSDELQVRKTYLTSMFANNNRSNDAVILREYFNEAYYFIPLYLATQLSAKGYYEEALKWFKTVYDYTQQDPTKKNLYSFLQLDDATSSSNIVRSGSWLLDPLNPHALALTRKDNYLKYTLFSLAQLFNAYANSEFTMDTVESIDRATKLYEYAQSILQMSIFTPLPESCDVKILKNVEQLLCSNPELAEYVSTIELILEGLAAIGLNATSANTHFLAILDILTSSAPVIERLKDAEDYVESIAIPIPPLSSHISGLVSQLQSNAVNGVISAVSTIDGFGAQAAHLVGVSNTHIWNVAGTPTTHNPVWATSVHTIDMSNPILQQIGPSPTIQQLLELQNAVINNPFEAYNTLSAYSMPTIPFGDSTLSFCIPINPVYQYLTLSAELNLYKIRNCMNIAGMRRELDPYAAPTDLYTGLPQIGNNGELVLPGLQVVRPTIYRYEYLVERAKQIISVAQQIESSFLSTLEKQDAERYSQLKAKQDLALSKATVKLKELSVKVANGEVDLAVLQKERAEIQVQELDRMINEGFNEFEEKMMKMYWGIASLQSIISAGDLLIDMGSASGSDLFGINETINKGLVGTGWGLKLAATISQAFLEAGININSLYAQKDRREQGWNYEKKLASQDIRIGGQQVKVAQDRVRVAEQDRKISEIQQQHAEATVDFLQNKFTNAELYEWMSGVLERVYSYFLQEATAVARLAQTQLAFERQDYLQSIVQNDYWEMPAADSIISSENNGSIDRRGLTGSSRLLQDIYKLDQYAFNTDKRKLQMVKTFSLASYFPLEFQQFKATGEINFETLMDYFDQDFPGHYMRLIKRVRTHVIALVPPTQGIKATLMSSGISRVVSSGSIFQEVIVRRDPEMIALTGNRESAGVFELQAQDPKMLNPFEGSGVHTGFMLKMPKASNLFDFNTIADVLVTIEYTALHSFDYEQQVNRRLGNDITADRAFSLKNDFADAFYQLNHPEEFTDGATVQIPISEFDFPAGISDIGLNEAKLYFLVKEEDRDTLFNGQHINGAINTTSLNGKLISSKGICNLGYTGSPFGTWTLDFSDLIKVTQNVNHFADGKILDVILAFNYSGELPKRI